MPLAIRSRIATTPGLEHHLLWSRANSHLVDGMAVQTYDLPIGIRDRIGTVRRIVDRIRPDVVHAHSSWAGAYARMWALGVPVVYEPHCFKFDDPNLNPVIRSSLRLAEVALADRTAAFGVLTQHEESLARGLGRHARVVRIPNIPTMPATSETATVHRGRVAMAGRLSKQKDPEFFAAVFTALKVAGAPAEALWIGDGDPAYKRRLNELGVTVTGWLKGQDLADALRGSVYVHTAAYEGFPLSILDASAVGVPIVARRLKALAGTAILQADTPQEIAGHVTALSEPGDAQARALAANSSLLNEHSPARLEAALLTLYEAALR